MTDYRELSAELLAALKIQLGELAADNRLCKKAEAALAEELPTVDELYNKSMCNYMVEYMAEDQSGIALDGVFSRQELLELAYSKPPEDLR
jgi:hypothetical protein